MILAQSAATAAVISLEDNLSVQDISYEKLSSQLLKDGQVLELIKDNRVAFGVGIDPDDFNGVVVDGNQIIFEGEWVESTSLRPLLGFHIIMMEMVVRV